MYLRILLLSVIVLISISTRAQQRIQHARRAGWYSLVYRISADTAEKYLKKYIAFPDQLLKQEPVAKFKTDSLDLDNLPTGNYMIISAVEDELISTYHCQSLLRVNAINDQHRVQLEVKDKDGRLISNATVFINGKQVKFDQQSQSYHLPGKKLDEAIIKIATPGDTLFMEMAALEDIEFNGWQQWWRNFASAKMGCIISWPVRSVKTMITRPARAWFRKKRRPNSNNGYMLFNKPKYLPGDTMKFKAYVLNKKYKRYTGPLNIYFDYSGKTKHEHKKIATIKPVSPGAYVYDMLLSDSLENDRSYTVGLFGKKNRRLMMGNFKMEDYLLDEVATYNLRAEKQTYYKNDTMIFYASAKDANGLALMDGRLNIYVLPKSINQFYKDKEFVPDTLWKAEAVLQTDGETKLVVPTPNFPAADISLRVLVEFRNSNNEIQEQESDIEFVSKDKWMHVSQEGRLIKAELMENGRSVNATGWMKEDDEEEVKINFPFSKKINPFYGKYLFEIRNDSGKVLLYHAEEIKNNYTISLDRVQLRDTTGFVLNNPYQVPVHYTVFNGNKVIASGGDSSELITWKKVLQRKTSFTVAWNYMWGGEERKDKENIAVLDKVLKTSITGSPVIYPGQKDTITVTVKDYKDNPADEINLTAVSYNSQFGKDIRVNEPPYLQHFKGRRRILTDNYELDDAFLRKNFVLGHHQDWRSKLALDTMAFYKLLFPKDSLTRVVQPIADLRPQVAVHVVKKGVPQEIYLLYINREFVYYNGVTDQSKYAFTVWPGYTQISIRLKEKLIRVDSIYLQPYYKYDLVFDEDNLPAKARVLKEPNSYTNDERNQIENQVMQLQNDYRTNYGYLWQDNKLVYISASRPHLIGPFLPNEDLQYFKPGDFDLQFPFESHYEYKLSSKVARLERKNIFYQSYKATIKLPAVQKTKWILGDTIVPPPAIIYPIPIARPYMRVNDYANDRGASSLHGALKIQLPPDSVFIYAALFEDAFDSSYRIKNYGITEFSHLSPGGYHLVLVTNKYSYVETAVPQLKAGGTTCIKISAPVYGGANGYIESLAAKYDVETEKRRSKEPVEVKKENAFVTPALPFPTGAGAIRGRIIDAKGGEPIVFAVVHIKGYSSGAATDGKGNFIINNIRPGYYFLVASSVGYEQKEISVQVKEYVDANVLITLNVSTMALSEVVVTAYGVQRSSRQLAYSVTSIKGKDLTASLMGRVPGLADYERRDSARIMIRGIRSLDDKAIYVVNGIVMDQLPDGFDLSKAQVNVLKGEVATSLYGTRAANGVIIVTTPDFLPKSLRDKFRDYAFWEPNLFTDKDGKVKFTVTYPDNITGWQTYVVGMDKNRRFTKASFFTKSFKPLLAQLSTPQFLIEGDSSYLMGKTINYTTNRTSIKTEFKINDRPVINGDKELNQNASSSDFLPVMAKTADTIHVEYTATAITGYSDGELRKVPVFKRGIEEAKGNFWILENDTSFSFTPDANAGEIKLYAQNNTLDVLLDEIKYLKEYPYYCMEQTASKLTGLIMEKEIRKKLNEDFTGEKELQKLLKKLQESQEFDGGWAWWPGGETNITVTNYVAQALLPLRKDPLIESSLRNGLLFLQNRLPLLKRNELLASLVTLSEAGHYMDYKSQLDKIPFDSLTLHQQWQYVTIKQKQQLDFEKELTKLMNKKIGTMLGGLHWGTDSYYWESNEMATTVLAFKFFQHEEKYRSFLQPIIQYFLERRQGGRWRNTVESSKTVEAILPVLLEQRSDFRKEPVLTVTAAQTISVNKFPFSYSISTNSNTVTISKSGGGLMYVTAWQKIFNPIPQPVSDKFEISTWYERSGTTISYLKAGEKTTMKIKVNVLKDADYVQLEIPIPAGCTYSEKNQKANSMHTEYFKNKIVLFAERLKAGIYNYTIGLEPRYNGVYNLNPAKAELMYFPTFYGRNELKKVEIKSE
jgi:TonB-dependent SusC/RagA subfamily outer membrane receptor